MGKTRKRLLVITGPTATGKTSLALHLSKALNGELISADSRQVYKYMDIGTGKERSSEVKIWGYDLVNPDDEFSVSDFKKFADKTIDDIYERGKLPILVGGTGLYIKAVVDDLERIDIPRNLKLREELKDKTVEELLGMLGEKASKLNESDKNNPRRLIRLFEVLSSSEVHEKSKEKIKFDEVLWIGLTTSKEKLKERIGRRVDARVKMGIESEIEFLKKKDFFRYAPSVTLGYKDWPDIDRWKVEEFKYAKRQMTWFKREARIRWFDVENTDWKEKVEELVKKWYL